mmetsp:Transcript_26547/g.38805  ORF Transcript_26547/g.38805 Transcript_26547/m.38805 type:complete len:713 (+) Transcript_26547:1-2139(+)
MEQILYWKMFKEKEEEEVVDEDGMEKEKEEENPNGGDVISSFEVEKKKKKKKQSQLVENQQLTDALCPVIIATARLSRCFADSMLSFLFEQFHRLLLSNNNSQQQHRYNSLKVVCRLISFLASAQPQSVLMHMEDLQELSEFVLNNCSDDDGDVKGGSSSKNTVKNDKNNKDGNVMMADIIAACLSCKMAFHSPSVEGALKCESLTRSLLFRNDNKKDTATTATRLSAWTIFQLARHAYTTANFGIAHDLFTQKLLSTSSSTEKSYLWLSALSKTAKAEDIISKEGILGVSRASVLLDSSIAHIQSLSSLSGVGSQLDDYGDDEDDNDNENPFSFQLHLLHHRLDFLNLCVTARGLCAEMKLTGSVPMKGTRSFLHQRNACHCFYALASRYFRLYSLHGIMHTQQTRTSLRMLYALCRFMGDALSKVFAEAVVGSSGGSNASRLSRIHSLATSPWPVGDSTHPASNLIRILKEKVIEPMGESIDPIVRASVIIQVLDTVLMCPVPSPRGFLSIKPPSRAELRMSGHPNSVSPVKCEEGEGCEKMDDEAEVLDVLPGLPCTVYISGKVPRSYFQKADLSFSQVVLWHKVHYDGPLDRADGDDQDGGEEQQSEVDGAGGNNDDSSMNLSAEDGEDENRTDSPIATALLPNGRFFFSIEWVAPRHRDGYYRMQVRLGCRDVRFAEWEISTLPNTDTIFLCVKSRSDDESGSLSGV